MTDNKPIFKLNKSGYNRFEVDNFIDDKLTELTLLTNRCDIYQKEVERLNLEISKLTVTNTKLKLDLDEAEFAYSKMNRIALKQANEIIQSASDDADIIVKEALSEAKIILNDLQSLSKETAETKVALKEKLTKLIANLDQLEFVKIPNVEWIEESFKK
jgi:cell division initiation protein